MADFNPIFEIDASKILVKLHLAGRAAIPNSKVINTGIKNDPDKADPSKPGNTEFEFSKTGEYQLAILKKIEYRIPIELSCNKVIEKADKDLQGKGLPSLFDEKAQEEADKEAKEEDKNPDKDKKDKEKDIDKEKEKKEADEKTSLTDKDAQKKTEINDSLHIPSFLGYITEADDKDKKEKEKKQKEINKIYETIIKELDSYADFKVAGEMKNMFNDNGYEKKSKPEDFKETWKKFNECLNLENKHRLEYQAKVFDDLKGAALKDLTDYFITFAGKDNQAKIDQAKIAQVILDTDGKTYDKPNAFDKMKNGKIDASSVTAELEKQKQEFQVKEPNKLLAITIGCAVGYKIDIE